MFTFDETWEYLVDYEVATDAELKLVCDINGHTTESLLDVLYARTGYSELEQLMDEIKHELGWYN